MEKTQRIPEVESLRGLGILGILLFHYTQRYHELFNSVEWPSFFQYGKYGVLLFFMISGWAFFMSLGKIKTPKDFIVSRISRLYPAYWTGIILTFTTLSLFPLPERSSSWQDALINLTMLEGFLKVPYVDGVYWFLTILLLFNFWMFVVLLLKGFSHFKIWGTLWLLTACLWHLAESHFNLPSSIKTILLIRDGGFFLAGICFYMIQKHPQSKIYHLMILAFLLMQACWADTKIFFSSLVITSVFYLLIYNKLRFLNQRALIFLGTISYSLYLIHQNIGYVLMRYFYSVQIPPFLTVSITALGIILLSTFITFAIEKPAWKMIRSFFYPQKNAVKSS